MGVLDLDCLTTDSDATTYYGFTFTSSYDDAPNPYTSNAVLVKSNSNPVSPYNLTWSVVSRIESRYLMGSIEGSISCAVDAQGVFTAFRRYKGMSSYTTSLPFGLRYDPTGTMDAKFNVKGPGAWMNITVDPSYAWSKDYTNQVLGYVSNGASNVLIHAVLDKANNTIYVASVNEATKTLTAAGLWRMNKTIHGVPKVLAIGNDHLYTFGDIDFALNDPTFLTGFPLTTISQITPVGKIYNTTRTHKCPWSMTLYLYINHGTLTLICSQVPGLSFPSTLYTIADPNNVLDLGPPAVNFTKDIIYGDFLIPIGGGPGQASFSLMQKNMNMYAFGKDYTGWMFADQISRVNVTDTVGINPNPRPSSSSSDSDSSSGAGVIVGTIAGIVFVGGLLVWFIRRNNNTNKDSAKPAVGNNHPAFTQVNNYTYAQQPGPNGGPNYYNPSAQYPAGQYPGTYPTTTYPLGQNAPTTILPMAPISSMPQPQTFQGQMQGLQFSSHPRPNFVTTAYGSEPQTPNTMSGATGTVGAPWQPVPWQPTPFVPPTRPINSEDLPSPSASHSPGATAFSSVTAQASHDQQTPLTPKEPALPKPLPTPPSIPRDTRPATDAESP
ncbi:hypothetical protein BGX23_003876 [Mortierella sp. AD031]|nr:hypothetical protein BGX23_003876 [Mortierella sp. AD031]KAG0218961.1 hypothetical protein BGX33_005227 [Mortierella sp. NVP41]